MECRFHRHWGNGGGGDLRAAGAGCVANGSLDLGRLCFGGIVAMFSGYAYARLGASYPSNGGIIDFFRRGLGNGVFSLALSLLYLLTLAVSIAMVARAFGAYAVQFLHEGSQEEHLILLYALGIIAVMTLFNSLSNHAVGRLEVILVGIKMMILLLLIIAGVWSLQPAHISVSAPPAPVRSSPVSG